MASPNTPSPATSTSDMTSASGSAGMPVIDRTSATAVAASAAAPAATVIGTMNRFQWNQVAPAVTSAMPPTSRPATVSPGSRPKIASPYSTRKPIIVAATPPANASRSEEHTSELQSLMRISYAVFCLKNKKTTNNNNPTTQTHKYKK